MYLPFSHAFRVGQVGLGDPWHPEEKKKWDIFFTLLFLIIHVVVAKVSIGDPYNLVTVMR